MELKNFIKSSIRKHLTEEKKSQKNINDNFWKWFGNSKIVDNGTPMVVYHQNLEGDNKFTEFKPQSFGSFGQNSMFYFAKDKNWIKNFVKQFDKSQLSEKPRNFFLSIQNPLNLKGIKLTPKEWIEFLKDKNLLTPSIEEKLNNQPEIRYMKRNEIFSWLIYRYDNGEFVDKLKNAGYDGIIQDDSNYGRTNDVTTYVAISPKQIKSTQNDGTWDANDNNIYS